MAKLNPFRWSTKYQDDETDLLYYGYRYYNPSTGRWTSRDPLGEKGGLNLYGFVKNNSITRHDVLGMRDYKTGTDDPSTPTAPGAGEWASVAINPITAIIQYQVEEVLDANLFGLGLGDIYRMPDAVAHLRHYFGNSGSDYPIRLQNMIDEVPSASALFDLELRLAQRYVESLPTGTHDITSGRASSGYNTKEQNPNWYYAVGGYYSWGKGKAKNCDGNYVLQFEYKFFDRYNWDAGKQVQIAGITITDEFMGSFHLMGLAHEFDMRGSVKKTAKWKRGGIPEVSNGWGWEGGR